MVQKLSAVMLCVICIFFIGTGIYIILDARTMYQESLKPLATNVKPRYEAFKEGYDLAHTFFILGAGALITLLLLPRLQSISFGSFNVSLKDVQARVDTLTELQNELQQLINQIGGGKKADAETYDRVKENVSKSRFEISKEEKKGEFPDDPQKGKWGGKSNSRTRELTAIVKKSTLPDLYVVHLIVRSTDKNDPLTGTVYFHLHNTFINQNPAIIAQNNKAELKLSMVWGAFTVGVEADNSTTQLELDLAELPNAPDEFKSR